MTATDYLLGFRHHCTVDNNNQHHCSVKVSDHETVETITGHETQGDAIRYVDVLLLQRRVDELEGKMAEMRGAADYYREALEKYEPWLREEAEG